MSRTCPLCDFKMDGMAALENGKWVMEYVDVDLDYFCLEWGDDWAHIYYHAAESVE